MTDQSVLKYLDSCLYLTARLSAVAGYEWLSPDEVVTALQEEQPQAWELYSAFEASYQNWWEQSKILNAIRSSGEPSSGDIQKITQATILRDNTRTALQDHFK